MRENLDILRKLRKVCITRPIDPDPELTSLVGNTPGHAFLRNPAVQLVYQRLVHVVYEVSQKWTGQPFANLDIMDWGCGKGHVTWLLGKLGGKVTACDVVDGTDSSFSRATPIIDSTGISVMPLDHDWKLPFANNSFDVVVGFGVLEHVPQENRSLSEIHRVLRSGGMYYCFNLPRRMSWTQAVTRMMHTCPHDRLYFMRQIRNMVQKEGFTVLDAWRGQLFPKNTLHVPLPELMDRLDTFLVDWTPFGYLATNLHLVLAKEN